MLALRFGLAAAAALLLLAGRVGAQEDAPKTVEDQKFCPMMVKKEVDAESAIVEYKGIKIRLCCDVCVEKFNEYPEAYLLKEYLPQLNGLEVPPRKIKQTFCPVYPDRVVHEKDLCVEYKGKKVYLFNKAALKKWQKNPDKYANPKILPQLLEDEAGGDGSAPQQESESAAGVGN